ncbi:NAD(P)-binding protein [Auriscalpium vulgare]|uniref:NAD(P)-binding protein n=1 Tax=Auriscalpium vulgare TaxID=40419 RepID=A0ACB8RVL9_9AGAM|nr:NAD(P)-binding protein [Auriscalpium vulgare]
MSLLILSASDVDRVTASWQPSHLLSNAARVFSALSPGQDLVSAPHRTAIATDAHRALFMPARIAGTGTTIKVVSVPTRANDVGGLPASTLVLDERTGGARAVVNARGLTALRTAAGSVLATTLVHPPSSRQPVHLVAFGAGKQIQAHVNLLLATYPTLSTVTIVNRTYSGRLLALVSHLTERHPSTQFATIPASAGGTHADPTVLDALRSADFIVTATSSTAALFPSEWVPSGAHVILVGSYTPEMHEIDSALVRRCARVVVDSRAACRVEAGELIAAGLADADMVELGELLEASPRDGEQWRPNEAACEAVRHAGGDVTIFKSVGVGAQDVGIACAVVDRALELGVGNIVEEYDS